MITPRATIGLASVLVASLMATAFAVADAPDVDAIRGVVRAVEQAAIATELTARVADVFVREGDAFKAGSVLIAFDCRRQEATLAAAAAQQLEMQLTVDKLKLLQRAQSVGKNDLEVAEARLAKASAESDALKSQIEQCRVVAPFDGRVLELTLHRHETVQPGKPFVSIVGTNDLELDLIVPSSWVRWLIVGTPLTFHIDELETTAAAKVARIGAAVDAISQTLKVTAKFDRAERSVLPGMSGSAMFEARERP